MKNLFLTLSFIFISLTTFAQNQFEGMWISNKSTYITTILASENAVVKVINFSFDENKIIEEKILSQTEDFFVTELYNKDNGYKVIITYKLDNKGNLFCEYSGDYNGTSVSTIFKT